MFKSLSDEFHFLAPVPILVNALILYFINANFMESYNEELNGILSMKGWYMWNFSFCFLVTLCFMRVTTIIRLTSSGSITTVDGYFAVVANMFALAFAFCFWTMVNAVPGQTGAHLASLEMIQRWFLVSYLIWSVLWSRHIRLGWNPGQNWFFCLMLAMLCYTMLIHRATFYFLLSVAATLAAISTREFYKIHFYRGRHMQLIYGTLLVTHLAIVTLYLAEASHLGSVFFLFAVNLSYQLFVPVLVQINEHKSF